MGAVIDVEIFLVHEEFAEVAYDAPTGAFVEFFGAGVGEGNVAAQAADFAGRRAGSGLVGGAAFGFGAQDGELGVAVVVEVNERGAQLVPGPLAAGGAERIEGRRGGHGVNGEFLPRPKSELFPDGHEVFGADPTGLAGLEGEVAPAEERLVNAGETAGGERSGFLRDVGFGWN